MSEVALVAVTSAVSVLTLVISRIRCIIRPCAGDGERCISGCTDQALRRDEHNIDVCHYELNGRDVLVLTAKE